MLTWSLFYYWILPSVILAVVDWFLFARSDRHSQRYERCWLITIVTALLLCGASVLIAYCFGGASGAQAPQGGGGLAVDRMQIRLDLLAVTLLIFVILFPFLFLPAFPTAVVASFFPPHRYTRLMRIRLALAVTFAVAIMAVLLWLRFTDAAIWS